MTMTFTALVRMEMPHWDPGAAWKRYLESGGKDVEVPRKGKTCSDGIRDYLASLSKNKMSIPSLRDMAMQLQDVAVQRQAQEDEARATQAEVWRAEVYRRQQLLTAQLEEARARVHAEAEERRRRLTDSLRNSAANDAPAPLPPQWDPDFWTTVTRWSVAMDPEAALDTVRRTYSLHPASERNMTPSERYARDYYAMYGQAQPAQQEISPT